MTYQLARSCAAILFLIAIVSAQSASSTKTTDEKKARAERDKKTLELVDEIVRDGESLRLPENRIRVNIVLADSLWPRDGKRALLLFKQAVAAFGEMDPASADNAGRDYVTQLQQQLRQEILHVAGNHDPALALEFLRSTRGMSPERRQYWQPNYEAQLEMQLATQIADKNPKEALAVGEDSLKLGLGQDATGLLYSLGARDKTAAETFLDDILQQIRAGESSRSQAAPYVALTLLRTWIQNNRAVDESKEGPPSGLSLANLNAETARELSGFIINSVLNSGSPDSSTSPVRIIVDRGGMGYGYPGQLLGIIQQLRPMLPDVEKLSPAQIPALNKRIAEFDKFNEEQQGPWAKYQQLTRTGTAEELMQAATTAPVGISDSLLQQAAWKAIGQNDNEAAQKIIDKFPDPRQRAEMQLNLDRQRFQRAESEKKVAEARALMSRFPLEERAVLLSQMATSIASENKPAALDLLSEAEGLLGDRASSYQQLRAQLQIASAYEQLIPGKSASIVEKAINQLNELAVAALVLNGFDLQQYFRNGELVINAGNSLTEMAQESSQRLASISRNDFDRAKSVAEEFQRPELRMMALLQIAKAALANDNR
jgi:hypothetical protein